VLLLSSDGKAKRLSDKEFPKQGRYGKGVRIWSLSGKTTLAALAAGKPSLPLTVHMTKGAPKSFRMDAATVRRRAATKGDLVVEVKPGEEITGVGLPWTPERYVDVSAKPPEKAAPKRPKATAAPAAASFKRKRAAAPKTKPKTRTAKKPAKKKG
jgi:DNA gyrase/topoisomerase IV subunit A-like protein